MAQVEVESEAACTHLDVRAHLIRALEADLIGPQLADEVLPQRPGQWYLTGFVVPHGAPMGASSATMQQAELQWQDDGGTNQPLSKAADDGASDRPPPTPPRLPSSVGLTVLVKPGVSSLEVRLRWGAYRRYVEAELDALRAALGLGEDPADDPETLTADDGGGPKAPDRKKRRGAWWRRTPVEVAPFAVALVEGEQPAPVAVPGHPDLYLTVRTRPAPSDPTRADGTRVVSVFLSNRRSATPKATLDERALFQVELMVVCPQGFVARTTAMHAEADTLDQRRNDVQFRQHAEWAVGHGVSTRALADPETRAPVEMGQTATAVRTDCLPEARVYRMKATSKPDVTLEMQALADVDSPAALRAALAGLAPAYRAWIAERRAQSDAFDIEARRETGEMLMEEAAQACDRIEAAFAVFEADGQAFDAFRLANRAMARAARKVRPHLEPQWRLFQLAFLLLNVQGVADPDSKLKTERARVELLFFPTGGGKTEAYFGVAAFTMLLRRLRHRQAGHEGAGVAVLLRYTLRLLTLDQLQRASTLTCALELERRADPDRLGVTPFSIGLWVGRKATPNYLRDAREDNDRYWANPSNPRYSLPCPLTACPWCGTAFTKDCFAFDGTKKAPTRMRIGCEDFDCAFGFDADPNGVPLHCVDEQIYRVLPTFVVGTVDKFALLPWRGEAGALFGRVRGRDDRGFVPWSMLPTKGMLPLPSGLLPPTLVIQDELHLITGPLGTMVGLYEAAIEGMCRGPDGHPPKIIASTATARLADRQIEALFGRKTTSLFPPPGPDAGDSFFAEEERAEVKSRLYVGVAAPGRSHKAMMVRVYSALMAAAYRLWAAADEAGVGFADNPADPYCSLVAYFNSLRELGGAQRLVQEEVAPRANRLERRRPKQVADGGLFRNRLLGFDVYEMTSRLNSDAIRTTRDRFRAHFGSKQGGKSDVLLASSMISVGVDIPRLGLMVVNGQPRTVAEYIQASSRVGRETPGLVVTLHNLNKPRDRSHYERFTAFHEAFYRDVEAASVTPFSSRAVDRGLAGAMMAFARHHDRKLSPPKGTTHVDAVDGLANAAAEVFAERARRLEKGGGESLAGDVAGRVKGLISDWSGLAESLQKDTVQFSWSPWEKQGGQRLLRTLDAPKDEEDARFDRFRAPTSMRDVEPTVHLWVNRTPQNADKGK